jgi:hypothetical protein
MILAVGIGEPIPQPARVPTQLSPAAVTGCHPLGQAGCCLRLKEDSRCKCSWQPLGLTSS